jgi:NitT/TauT family transport system permease protein
MRSLRGLIVPIVLLVLWEIAGRTGIVSTLVLPPPSAVIHRLLEAVAPPEGGDHTPLAWLVSGELQRDAFASMTRIVLGFLIGAGLALPLGLAMGASDRVYAYLNPLLQILRPIPPIAYIPLAIIWFGLGNAPALFLIALGAFFPVLMSSIAGVRQVDSIYIRAAQNLGVGRFRMFSRVILPAATPHILTGVRVSIGTAFIVVIVAEMIAVSDGLGFRILEAREYMWSDKIIAGMAAIGTLGLLIDIGVSRLNNRLLRWHRGLSQEGGKR